MSADAIILLAHGSRDALWRRPIEAVAERLRASPGAPRVECAYLELCEPTLDQCARSLAAEGAARVTVVPLFLGMGRHVREDLPRLMDQLRGRWPGTAFELRPPVGEDPRLIDLLARIAGADPR